jgi:hypothetical protein
MMNRIHLTQNHYRRPWSAAVTLGLLALALSVATAEARIKSIKMATGPVENSNQNDYELGITRLQRVLLPQLDPGGGTPFISDPSLFGNAEVADVDLSPLLRRLGEEGLRAEPVRLTIEIGEFGSLVDSAAVRPVLAAPLDLADASLPPPSLGPQGFGFQLGGAAPVPEPATAGLAVGLLPLLLRRRR